MPRSIGHDPFIAMTMMMKKEKGTKKKVMNIKCDRSSQDDDTRVPSGTRFETSGNPRFEKDKTSEMETSPPSPQTQRVKKRPLERALPLCACPISIAASTLMDLSRSLLTSPIENEKSSCFYSSLGEKCEKTTKTKLVSTKKPRTKTVRKKKEETYRSAPVVPQKKYSVFTSSIPHVGIWDSSPHKLLRRAKAVEKMLCDLLQ